MSLYSEGSNITNDELSSQMNDVFKEQLINNMNKDAELDNAKHVAFNSAIHNAESGEAYKFAGNVANNIAFGLTSFDTGYNFSGTEQGGAVGEAIGGLTGGLLTGFVIKKGGALLGSTVKKIFPELYKNPFAKNIDNAFAKARKYDNGLESSKAYWYRMGMYGLTDVAINTGIATFQQTSYMTKDGVEHHRAEIGSKEWVGSVIANIAMSTPAVLGVNAFLERKDYNNYKKIIDDIASTQTGVSQIKDEKVFKEFSDSVVSQFGHNDGSVEKIDATEEQIKKEQKRQNDEKSKRTKAVLDNANKKEDDSDRINDIKEEVNRDKFDDIQDGSYSKTYDLYYEKENKTKHKVKLLGAVDQYKTKDDISHSEDIILNKVSKKDSKLEDISDVYNELNDNEKKELETQFKELKDEYEKSLIKNDDQEKNIKSFKSKVKKFKENIIKKEKEKFGHMKKIKTRIRVRTHAGNKFELIRTNKKEIKSIKEATLKELEAQIDKLNSIKYEKKFNKALEELKKDNALFDALSKLNDKEVKNIREFLKDKKNIELLKEYFKDNIDINFIDAHAVHLGDKFDIGMFDTRVGHEKELLVTPNNHEYTSNRLYIPVEQEKSTKESNIKYAIALAHMLNKLGVKNKKDMSIKELREKIATEMSDPTSDVFKYHAAHVISAVNGAILKDEFTIDDVKSKFDLTEEEEKVVKEMINDIKTKLKEANIDESEGIVLDGNENFEQKKEFSYYNAISQLANFLNDKDHTYIIPDSYMDHLLNIKRNVEERLNLMNELLQLSEPIEIDKHFDNYVFQLENKINDYLQNKSIDHNDMHDKLLLTIVKYDEKTKTYKIKKEFKALLYQASIKKISESFTSIKKKEYIDETTGEKTTTYYLSRNDGDILDLDKLGSDIFKKALIDSGIKLKSENIDMDNILRKTSEIVFGSDLGIENILKQLQDGVNINNKNEKDIHVAINTIGKIKKTGISTAKYSLDKSTKDTVKTTVNGNEVDIDPTLLFNDLNSEIEVINNKYNYSYQNDHIRTSKDLNPTSPSPINNKIIEMLEESLNEYDEDGNIKKGFNPNSLTDEVKKQILISNSKAILNNSEESLVKAMANATVESFNNDSDHRKAIETVKEKFKIIEDFLKNDNEKTHDDYINFVKALKFLKIDSSNVVSINISSKSYTNIINTIESYKNQGKHISMEEFKKISNDYMFNDENIDVIIQNAMEFKSQFDDMYKMVIKEDIEGLQTKINLTFSGRAMEDGSLSHQTNKFAKLFIKMDSKKNIEQLAKENNYEYGHFEVAKDAEDFIISSIKTMIDEIDGIDILEEKLKELKQRKNTNIKDIKELNDLINKFKIKNGKIKIEKSNNHEIKDYLMVVKYVVENIDEEINSYKIATYLPKLQYIYKEFRLQNNKNIKFNLNKTILQKRYKEFDSTQVIAEFDGNQNMIGIMNAIFGNTDDATGINGHIQNAQKDFYELFSDLLLDTFNSDPVLSSIFERVNFKRNDAKKPAQAHGYGQMFKATLTNAISDAIKKDFNLIKDSYDVMQNSKDIRDDIISLVHDRYINDLISNGRIDLPYKTHLDNAVKEYYEKMFKFNLLNDIQEESLTNTEYIAIYNYLMDTNKIENIFGNVSLGSQSYNLINDFLASINGSNSDVYINNKQNNNAHKFSIVKIESKLKELKNSDPEAYNKLNSQLNNVKIQLKSLADISNKDTIINAIKSDIYIKDNTEILLMKIKNDIEKKGYKIQSDDIIIQTYIEKSILEYAKKVNKENAEKIHERVNVDVADTKNKNTGYQQISNEDVKNEFTSVINEEVLKDRFYKKYNSNVFIDNFASALCTDKLEDQFKHLIYNDEKYNMFKQIEMFKSLIERTYSLHAIQANKVMLNEVVNPNKFVNNLTNEFDISDEQKKDIELKLDKIKSKNGFISYQDIYDTFRIVSDVDLFSSKSFIEKSNIPTLRTPTGRKILPFTVKGTGYKDGLTFQSMSGINKALTYFIQSTESHILSLSVHEALKQKKIKGIVHRFDATYGLQGMHVAKNQNKIYNALFADNTFFDYLKKENNLMLDNLMRDFIVDSGGGKINVAIENLAKQLIISKEGKITSEEVLHNKINEIKKLLSNDIRSSIDEKGNITYSVSKDSLNNLSEFFANTKKEKIDEIENKNNIVNSQFGNGILYDESSIDKSVKYIEEIRQIDDKKELSTNILINKIKGLKKEDISNIDISDMHDQYNGMSTFINSEAIDFFKLDSNFFNGNKMGEELSKKLEIIISNQEPKIEIDNATGKIKIFLKDGIKSTDEVYELVHEITHMFLHSRDNKSLLDEYRNSLLTIAKDIKDVDDSIDFRITFKDGGSLSLQEYADYFNDKKMPENLSDLDIGIKEFESSFMHILIGGDLIKSNKKLLAYISNGKKDSNGRINLNGTIQNISFIKNKKEVDYITSLKQFYNYLDDNQISGNRKGINKIVMNTYAVLNTNDNIKAYMLNEKRYNDEISPYILNQINKDQMITHEIIKKVNDKFFSSNDFYDLLNISRSGVAMKQALSLYDGFEKKLLVHANNIKEIFEAKLKEIDPVEWEKLDNDIGIITTFGLNILNSDLIKIGSELGKLLNKINTDFLTKSHVDENNMKMSLKQKLENVLNIEIKDKLVNHYKLSKDEVDMFYDLLSKVSKGNYYAKKDFIKFIQTHIDKKLTKHDTNILMEKLVSIKMLTSKRGLDVNSKFKDNIENVLNLMKSKDKAKNINEILFSFNKNRSKYTLFGSNIDLKFLKDNQNLYMSEKDLGSSHKVATIYRGDKKYYIYTQYINDTTYGRQDNQLINFNLDEFEKGVFEKTFKTNDENEEIVVSINPQNMKLQSNMFNSHISIQAQKNAYSSMKNKAGANQLYRQFKLLRENGVLLTKSEVEQMYGDTQTSKNNYVQVPENNPISTTFGTEFYINTSMEKYINGTSGINLSKLMNSFIKDPKQAEAVASAIKFITDLVKQLSSTILLMPQYLFNSWLGSYTTYAMHSTKGFTGYYRDSRTAKKMLKNFRRHFNEKLVLLKEKEKIEFNIHQNSDSNDLKNKLNKINRLIKEKDKELEDIGILQAFEYGIGSTMKLDMLSIDSKKELSMFQMIKNKFGENSEAYRFAKWISFDPKYNSLGEKGFNLFEETELVPKLALYVNRIHNGEKPSEAANYVNMAFPRYDNLGTFTSVMNDVIPYTKFMVDFPRVIAFMMIQNPSKYITTALIMNNLAMLGYGSGSALTMFGGGNENEFQSDHNILMFNDDIGLSLNAMVSNFELPIPFFNSNPIAGMSEWVTNIMEEPFNASIPLLYKK